MKVSIIIPSYNTRPAYLNECLAACYRQGLEEKDFEIILIDDGSEKSFCTAYAEWISSHENIRFFSQPNQGQSVARNRGIDYARGRYLCFVDADDFLRDGVLGRAFEKAENEKLDILYYNGTGAGSENGAQVLSGKEYLVQNGFRSAIWCFLVRTEFLVESKVRFAVGKLCEDGVFAYEVVSSAPRVSHLSGGQTYFYRLSENSTQRTYELPRKIKYLEGFFFAATFFQDTLAGISEKKEKCYFKLTLSCRNYYLLFLLFHLLDKEIPEADVQRLFSAMKEKKMFPFHGGNVVRGRKYRLMHFLLNGEFRFRIFRKLLGIDFVFHVVTLMCGAKSYNSKFRKKRSA